MRSSNVVIVLIFLSIANIVLSQKLKDNNAEKPMYFKAGIELASMSNVTVFKSGRNAYQTGAVNSLTGAIGVQFTKRLDFELQFKKMENFSYGYNEPHMFFPDGTKYYNYGSGTMNSAYLNLRANYFVNEKKRENPIYFIGALNIGFQHVENLEIKESPGMVEKTTNTFSRYIIGPEAGLGIFFDLGIFNFVFESTFSSRISPFSRDKKYTENTLTLNFSPVLKF
jgi:hypothetical protein